MDEPDELYEYQESRMKKIPEWLGTLLAVAALGLGSWTLQEISALKASNAATSIQFANQDRTNTEIKTVQAESEKRIESWLVRLGDKIDRISEAVGAKK